MSDTKTVEMNDKEYKDFVKFRISELASKKERLKESLDKKIETIDTEIKELKASLKAK